MRKRRIALCDWNEKYVFQLEEYFRGVNYLPFQADVYTNYESYCEYEEKYHYAGVLIAECFVRKEEHGRGMLFLTEERSEEVNTVYRYQSADVILQQIMNAFFEGELYGEQTLAANGEGVRIGFYSPIRRCLQTGFALTLGQILAKKSRVLYLNLEAFSGLGERFGVETEGDDLADLIYYYKNLPEEFEGRFQQARRRINELDYIPPALSFMDVQQLSEEEWDGFLERLRQSGRYEYMILDFSEALQGLPYLLSKCTRIYGIQRKDAVSQAKKVHYERVMKELRHEDILTKTVWYTLPQFVYLPDGVSQLAFSELADYVRGIMREESEVHIYAG